MARAKLTEKEKAARAKRVAAAKRKIKELLDKGVEFNPQTVSDFTIDAAVENKSRAAGPKGVVGGRSGSTDASVIKFREVNRASAPAPKAKSRRARRKQRKKN